MQITNPHFESFGEISFSKAGEPPRSSHFQDASFLNLKTKDPEAQRTFLNVLDKIQKKNERTEQKQTIQSTPIREPSKGSSKPLSDTQIEDILEGFFSKLVQKQEQEILQNQKVANKVERMLSNPLFNRILRRVDSSTFENNISVISSKVPSPVRTEPVITLPTWEDPEPISISSRIDASTIHHVGDLTDNSHQELRDAYGEFPQHSQKIDEYENDNDPGYYLYKTTKKDLEPASRQLATQYGFPDRVCVQDHQYVQVERSGDFFGIGEESDLDENIGENDEQEALELKYPPTNDEVYPIKFDKTKYNCLNIKYIFDENRTGFEETKDFPIVINSIIAGRYQILNYLGSAAFSDAIECLDLITQQRVCMKIIKNEKDYFDQSLDEIKLLQLINHNGNVDEKHVLKFHDCFYFKEHLFIVTELLQENLYEYSKLNQESNEAPYFTLDKLKIISKQVLEALDYVHGLGVIHCDLKPENILLKNPSTAQVKVIDFGSSCFKTDYLSSYIQSRPYRAPEVILGCKYGPKIDIWSLGCVLAEMWTGDTLFASETASGLLARVIGIIGPFPEKMFREGRITQNFFTQEKVLWQEGSDGDESIMSSGHQRNSRKREIELLVPKKSSLKHRLKTDDFWFLDFVQSLLQVDPEKRPSAQEAMMHPWLADA